MPLYKGNTLITGQPIGTPGTNSLIQNTYNAVVNSVKPSTDLVPDIKESLNNVATGVDIREAYSNLADLVDNRASDIAGTLQTLAELLKPKAQEYPDWTRAVPLTDLSVGRAVYVNSVDGWYVVQKASRSEVDALSEPMTDTHVVLGKNLEDEYDPEKTAMESFTSAICMQWPEGLTRAQAGTEMCMPYASAGDADVDPYTSTVSPGSKPATFSMFWFVPSTATPLSADKSGFVVPYERATT